MTSDRESAEFEYDVCLSFAGEDRAFVEKVASGLRDCGIRVFYDGYEEVDLWGKDLYSHLDDVYRHAARYCVMFVSSKYAAKLWTNHERQSAQSRAFKENAEYILPARFDDTAVPGLRETVGYVDLRHTNENKLVEMIEQKIGPRQTKNYLPPVPDRLFTALGAEDEDERNLIRSRAHKFLGILRRMSADERLVVFHFIGNGCPAELPDNTHINVDLLRRYTNFPVQKLKRILGNVNSLGFVISQRDDDETDPSRIGKSKMLVLEWHDLNLENGGNATDVAFEMISCATDGYCEEHGMQALERLDFSQLATITTVIDKH